MRAANAQFAQFSYTRQFAVFVQHQQLHVFNAAAQWDRPVGIGIAPTIPGLSIDIPELLQRAKDCGATKAFINMLRLPGSVAPYFEKRLREKLPTKADRVLNRIRDARGGKLNSSVFGERMRGKGQYWSAQEKLFEVYTRKLGFNEHRVGSERHTRANTFRRPTAQGSLFG